MKTTRKSTNVIEGRGYSFMYKDIPGDGEKNARIEEWENGEGADVWLGADMIELTFQEMNVLEKLFTEQRIIR